LIGLNLRRNGTGKTAQVNTSHLNPRPRIRGFGFKTVNRCNLLERLTDIVQAFQQTAFFKLINLKGKSAIAAVARVPRSEDDEDVVTVDEDGNVIETPPTETTEGTEGTENGTDIENNDAVE